MLLFPRFSLQKMVLYYARGSETDVITEQELEAALKEVFYMLGDK